MADGQLEGIWSQLLYATRTLSPGRLVLKVTLFLLLHCTGVFLCIWGVLTRLDWTSSVLCAMCCVPSHEESFYITWAYLALSNLYYQNKEFPSVIQQQKNVTLRRSLTGQVECPFFFLLSPPRGLFA